MKNKNIFSHLGTARLSFPRVFRFVSLVAITFDLTLRTVILRSLLESLQLLPLRMAVQQILSRISHGGHPRQANWGRDRAVGPECPPHTLMAFERCGKPTQSTLR